ncbi:MAG: DUF1987 domain-containing protein [Sedimentisphaeraceae bacterium JB056]
MINTKPTKSTPLIKFESDSSTMRIEGDCYPENSFEFFKPLFNWFRKEFPKYETFIFDINIGYMNSSTTKCMLDILDMLEEAHENGKNIQIIWKYDRENDRAMDLAEEFKEDVEMPFEIRPI